MKENHIENRQRSSDFVYTLRKNSLGKLTIENVKKCIDEIIRIKKYDSRAHSEEVDLRDWFIDSCSNGYYDMDELRKVSTHIDSTKYIDFIRYTD